MLIDFKKIGAVVLSLSLITGCVTGPKGMGKGAYQVRPHKTLTLANGLKVTVVEDASLPLLSMSLLVRGGSSMDPQGKDGLSSLVAKLFDKGTLLRDEQKLSEDLAEYAADFSSGANEDFTLSSISALSYYEGRLLKDFFEIITQPKFAEAEVNRYKKRLMANLKSTADEPQDIVVLGFEDFVYGKHPYAKPVAGRISSVKSIGRQDIVKHYQRTFQPGNSHLLIVGKVSKEFLSQVESTFGAWATQPVMQRQVKAISLDPKSEILLIAKDDLKQTQIRMGHIGISRNDPDFIPLRVASTILGGGLFSRLMKEIREKRGLTYSVNSYFDARWDKGVFTVGTFSRNDKVGETVTEVMKVVKDLRDKGVTESEVRDAVSFLKGQFPQALETPESFGTQILYLDFYGVDPNYFSTYLAQLDRLTAKDINRVIQEHIHPDAFKIVVHGPASLAEQLKGIAPVQVQKVMAYLE